MTTGLIPKDVKALTASPKRNRPYVLTAPIASEGDECANLLQWASVNRHQGLRLSDLIVMIPNGAVRAGDGKHRAMQMARMKKLGFRNGVADYFLPVITPRFGGLWLEMKRSHGGVVSQAQTDFEQAMITQGYATAVCEGWEAARRAIMNYLRTLTDEEHVDGA